MRRDPVTLLRELTAHEQFRPGQRKALQALLDGRDVVLVLPAGGGASLVAELARAGLEPGPLLVVDQASRLADVDRGFRPELWALRAERERQAPAATLAVPPLATPPVADEIAARLGLGDAVRVVAGIDVP